MLVSVVACSDGDVTTPPDDDTVDNGNNNNNSASDDWDTEGYHIYASNSGSDENDGLTEASSVKTIARAQEIAKTYVGNKEGLPVIISLDKGIYNTDKKISVISGSANTPVIFTSRNGRAVISGGTKITSDKIKPCTDAWVLDHIQSNEVKENLYEVDLSSYSSSLTTILNRLNVKDLSEREYDVIEFYRGDETIDLARWPNVGELGAAGEAENITTRGFEVTKYINYTDDNGSFITPEQATDKGSDWYRNTPMNVFVMDETYDIIKDWDFENQDIHTLNFFSQDWDDMIHKITGFTDISDAPLTVADISYKAYFTTDRGRIYNNPVNETKPFRRYNLINALEAIDLDGEYYYDYENKKMYVYFEDEASLDEFYLASNREGVLDINGVNNVSFRNVDIRHTQKTLVNVLNSTNISFIGCSVSNAAVKGAYVNNSTDVTIADSYFYDFGCGAIKFEDCNPPSDKEIVEANILVENCDIGYIDHRDLTYVYGVTVINCSGATVRRNRVHDGAHAAFSFKAVVLVFEYNEVYNFLTETDDVGLWYDHQTPETQAGIVMRYNYVHDIGSDWQVWGYNIWYSDSNSTCYSIYGNLVTDIKDGADSCNHVTIFGKLKIGGAWGNVVANVDDNVILTNIYRGDQFFWDWRNIHSPETAKDTNSLAYIHDNIANMGLYNGAWDTSRAATDDGFNYSYNMMKTALSKEFYYSVYGTGIAKFSALEEYADEDYLVQINNETVKDFVIKVKSGTYAGQEKSFDNIDDFYNFLYDNCGYRFETANLNLTPSFEIFYRSSAVNDEIKAYEMYPPIYTYNKNSGEWEFSRAAGYRDFNETNFWSDSDSAVCEQMGRLQFRAENTTNLGTYHDNLTVNMLYDLSNYGHWYHNGVSKYNNYDTEVEGITVIENGAYTGEFLDVFDTIKGMGAVPSLELLDLSRVGCTLKPKSR